jgi:HSP20 family protein
MLSPLSHWTRRDLADEPFTALQRELDRLFGDFARDFGKSAMPMVKAEAWTPRTDVREAKDQYEIVVELPGVAEKDIECTLSDGVLAIKGEKKTEKEQKEKHAHVRECSYGSFYRAFELPSDVQADKISASFANGVLTVRLPRQADAAAAGRKIAIGGEPAATGAEAAAKKVA